MKTTVDMNDPRVKRLVLAVALPAVAGLAASAGHHAINAIFLGALGPDVLAGISLVMPLFLLVAASGQGWVSGLRRCLRATLAKGISKPQRRSPRQRSRRRSRSASSCRC